MLLIIGVALGFTHYLIDAQVPDQLAAWAQVHVHSRWLFLLGLNVVLIAIGSLVEIYAAIIVAAPLLVPIGLQLGINPIHLGVIFLAIVDQRPRILDHGHPSSRARTAHRPNA